MAKKEEIYDDSWLYSLILITMTIFLEALKKYTFTIFNVNLTYALFLLPVVYLIANYIMKKYGYKKAVVSISISGLALVLFYTLVTVLLKRELLLTNISGEFCGYVISQFANLTIYAFLLNNTKLNYFLVVINYIFALVINYMFYTLIYLNKVVLNNFWKGYLITLLIQTVICFIIGFLDIKIKRGIEKDA